jgi:hypothetical protein
MLGQEDAREMLELVNAILSESPDAKELCDPLIKSALMDLEQEAEYQASKSSFDKPESTLSKDIEKIEEPSRPDMSKEELNNAIIDAYSRGDMEEVERLRKFLGESILFPRISLSFLRS